MSHPQQSGNSKASSIKLRKWYVLVLIVIALFACTVEFAPGTSQAKNPNRQTSAARKESTPAGKLSRQPRSSNLSKDSDELWQDTAALNLRESASSVDQPKSYRSLELNQSAFAQAIAEAPMEFTEEVNQRNVVISLPLPDGRLWRFRIQESPIMSQEWAAKFPEIKTYSGQDVDGSAASMRFSWSPAGLHAFVISEEGSFMVVPATKNDPQYYLSYLTSDVEMRSFKCFAPNVASALAEESPVNSASGMLGETLHIYRIAINVTPQFYAFNGNSSAITNENIITVLNSVNLIYQRETAIRFNLVGWALDVWGFLPPESEAETFLDAFAEGSQKMSNFLWHPANYDVGHAFGFFHSRMGIGDFNAVCDNSIPLIRAKGGSVFAGGFMQDMLLLTHELGHQLGAQHTFTPVLGACADFADPSSKYEPGSASTIMSYAGICPPDDLQAMPDTYFHIDSLRKISNHINTSPPCGAQIPTNNAPPVILDVTGRNAYIPARTPFALTGFAADSNGERVYYAWEQYDLNTALFRSNFPTENPTRFFPDLLYVRDYGNTPPFMRNGFRTGEALPTTSRTLSFALTARDFRPGGGGTSALEIKVFVRGEAGPFVVTEPNTSVTWTGASQRLITWNVANTNLAPISTANVRILLSTDGGYTFPTVLSSSTPNDGAEWVTLPNVQTSGARIAVEAVGNIYFDISNFNFTINQVAFPTSNRKTVGVFRPSNGKVYLKNSHSGGFSDIDLIYGVASDQPIAGDWNGDGIDTLGIYRNGTFYLRDANTTGPANHVFAFGAPGDQPIAGDWDGNGSVTVGVYRRSTGVFYLRNSNMAGPADAVFVLGNPGDVAIAGDWDGNGTTTTGVFRPSNGIIYLKNTNLSGVADMHLVYGNPGDLPLAGDWNGDGVDTIGIYRAGVFYLSDSNLQPFANWVFALGNNGDVPIAGDWDGLP